MPQVNATVVVVPEALAALVVALGMRDLAPV
jgi:hypothetical protein